MKNAKRPKSTKGPVHPGVVLKDYLANQAKVGATELSVKLSKASKGKVKSSTMLTKLSEILNEKRAVSVQFAVLLGKTLPTQPKKWLDLQLDYDLWKATNK